jgi:hypothetical protein
MTPRDKLSVLQAQLDAALLENAALKLQIADAEKQVLQKAVTDLSAQVTGLGGVPVVPVVS